MASTLRTRTKQEEDVTFVARRKAQVPEEKETQKVKITVLNVKFTFCRSVL